MNSSGAETTSELWSTRNILLVAAVLHSVPFVVYYIVHLVVSNPDTMRAVPSIGGVLFFSAIAVAPLATYGFFVFLSSWICPSEGLSSTQSAFAVLLGLFFLVYVGLMVGVLPSGAVQEDSTLVFPFFSLIHLVLAIFFGGICLIAAIMGRAKRPGW